MGPTWVLSAPGGPHVGPINLAIWDVICSCRAGNWRTSIPSCCFHMYVFHFVIKYPIGGFKEHSILLWLMGHLTGWAFLYITPLFMFYDLQHSFLHCLITSRWIDRVAVSIYQPRADNIHSPKMIWVLYLTSYMTNLIFNMGFCEKPITKRYIIRLPKTKYINIRTWYVCGNCGG